MPISGDTGPMRDWVLTINIPKCADCGCMLGRDPWELEDGRKVCQRCCVIDTRKTLAKLTEYLKQQEQPELKR